MHPLIRTLAQHTGLALLLATTAAPAIAQAPTAAPAATAAPKAPRPAQLSFATPDDAVTALVEAVKAGDRPRTLAVLGKGAGKVVDSGDAHTDLLTRASFVMAYERGHRIEPDGDKRATLLLGETEWPLPFPLVQQQGRWRFDTQAGVRQFLDRQIGANELQAMAVLANVVLAQQEYARRDRNGDGMLAYAQRMVSSEGARDGLYWPAEPGQPPSPMGARFALSSLGPLRGTDEAPQPFEGYFFRPLLAQGPHARGGAYDYVVNGRQIGGFAMIATPARWGVSGVMSFIVNHDGVIYARNLGPRTAEVAQRIERFDPDARWAREDGAVAAAR